VEARDDETIDERCRSWSQVHEEPVETTVVLLHGYPKLSSHAVAELMRLGTVTLEQARSEPHTAENVVLTTNPNDGAVRPETVEAIVAAWQENGADASVYEWPAEMGLGHNMVDDAANSGKFDAIYPILMDLFTEGQVTTEPVAGDDASAG
jgi:hypothetical protein